MVFGTTRTLTQTELELLFVGKTISKIYPNPDGSTQVFFEFTDGTIANIWSSEQMGTDLQGEQCYIDC